MHVPIPVELICKIIDDLEKLYFDSDEEQEAFASKLRDLLACRLVCRTFKDVCTPRAFKVVVVTQNERRINGFWNLFVHGKQNLARHVREVVYWEEWVEDWEEDESDGEQQTEERSPEPKLACTFSNLHLLPNLDTARIESFHRYSSGNPRNTTFADDDVQSDLEIEALLATEGLSQAPPHRRQLVILHSLAHSANTGIKHVYIRGLCLLPTTAKFFILSSRLVNLLSQLQTLSLEVTPRVTPSYHRNEDYHPKFWKRIGKLLVGAVSLTSLALGSDHCSSGPPCETWDAMTFPFLTTLNLSGFVLKGATDSEDIYTSFEAFLQRHLQEGSRLSEVVLDTVRVGSEATFIWGNVYDIIADRVSSSSHSALKTFQHLPTHNIGNCDNYIAYLPVDFFDYWHPSRGALDLKAYERLQTVLAGHKEV